MRYYRFRPMSELSIKELMYDEIFFASSNESNDPYEGKMFFEFEPDRDRWKRLIESAWVNCTFRNKNIVLEEYVNYLVKYSPLTFDEFRELGFKEIFDANNNDYSNYQDERLIKILKQYVETYMPPERYFVSFSRKADEYLMWSHYASNHKGYCLVFQTRGKCIYQSPDNQRTSIGRKTPNSFSPHVSTHIDVKFKMHDIIYTGVQSKDTAFMCFTPYIFGRDVQDEKERIAMCEKKQLPYLEKSRFWDYEAESRILLDAPISWLCGGRYEYTKYERLFHYDSTQLVGIILGAKMEESDKERIRSIIKYKVSKWYDSNTKDSKRCISNFVLFQAVLSQKQRNLEIIPIEIFGAGIPCDCEHPEFAGKYDSWKDGWYIEIEGNSVRRKKYTEDD